MLRWEKAAGRKRTGENLDGRCDHDAKGTSRIDNMDNLVDELDELA